MNEKQFPNYWLRRVNKNQKETVIVFRRNNLSFSDFIIENNKCYFSEKINYYGRTIYFFIEVITKNLYKIFDANSKDIKIKGSKYAFGIYFRMPDVSLPFDYSKKCGCVKLRIVCYGPPILYWRKKKKKKEKVFTFPADGRSHTISEEIPTSVSRAAAHPFRGGGFSSK